MARLRLHFSRKRLDNWATFLGLVSGISRVLGAQGIIDSKISGTVGGLALVFLGYLANKPPEWQQQDPPR